MEAARLSAVAASKEKEQEEAVQRQTAPKYGEAGYRWHAAIPQARPSMGWKMPCMCYFIVLGWVQKHM